MTKINPEEVNCIQDIKKYINISNYIKERYIISHLTYGGTYSNTIKWLINSKNTQRIVNLIKNTINITPYTYGDITSAINILAKKKIKVDTTIIAWFIYEKLCERLNEQLNKAKI